MNNLSSQEINPNDGLFNTTNTSNIDLISLEYCDTFNTSQQEDDVVDTSLISTFIIHGLLLSIVGIFGILGNIISMIILSKPQMKSSINYLLISLSRSDAVLITSSILLFGLPSIYRGTGYFFVYFYQVYPIIAPFVFPIGMIAQTVSVYVTLLVTLERFVAVCFPLHARSLCTRGRARLCVIFVIIFSVFYNITRFMEVEARICKHNYFGVYVYRLYPTSLRNNDYYINIYIQWMYLLFMYFIPFGFLAVLNTAIYRQVRKANQERQRLTSLQKKELGLAIMLLCVVVVFLICNFLALITNVMEAFTGTTYDILAEMGNLMVTLNSSLNFVIYIIFGEKFKKLFLKLFFPEGLKICGKAFNRDSVVGNIPEEIYSTLNGERNSLVRQHLHRMNSIRTSSSRSVNTRTSSINSNCSRSINVHLPLPNRKSQSAKIQRESFSRQCIYQPARQSRGSWEQTKHRF